MIKSYKVLVNKILLKGEFSFSRGELYYLPAPQERKTLPHKIKLRGTWKLDSSHNLQFIVDKSQNNTFGNSISFTTKVKQAAAGELSFILLKRATPTLRKINRLTFKGYWKLTKQGKLAFSFKRDNLSAELVCNSVWFISGKNQIEYIYRKTIGKRKSIETFILKGRWEYKHNRLVYRIQGSKASQLIFKVALSKTLISNKKDKLQFIVKFSNPKKGVFRRIITLSGKWRLASFGVAFIPESAVGKSEWRFKFSRTLSNGKEVEFSLINKQGEPLGYEVTFRKKLLNDGYYFLRGAWGDDKRLEGGLYFPF